MDRSENEEQAAHVPDFFVLRRTGAGFEEWTSAPALATRTRRMPGRYQEEQGVWRCPPGEAYATPLGLSYHIRSSASLHPLAAGCASIGGHR